MSDSPWQPPAPPAGPPLGAPVEVIPAPAERRRRAPALVAAVVAVVALGGAGVFAVSQLTASDDGGASTPEELGTSFLDALEHEDVLGLVDLLLPGERDAVRDPLVELVDELGRLEVLSDDATLGDVGGLDIAISGAQVGVEPTNVDDITNVRLTGDISATVDGEALPLGDLLLDELPDDARQVEESDTAPFDVPITAVEHDGRWYLSMFFAIAEQARGASAESPPIPAAGIEAIGGERPEDALDELLAGVERLDVQHLIAALNPGEAAALQRYAPLFLDEAAAGLEDVPLEWEITEAEYSVTGDGDRRHATVDVLAVEGVLDGAAFEVEVVDGCTRGRLLDDGTTFDSCELADAESAELDDLVGDAPEVTELVELMEDVFADLDVPGITLVRTDGEWYVSPLGTVLDQLLAVAGALDRDELDRLIDAVPPALDSLGGWFFGAPGGSFEEFEPDDPFDEQPDEPVDDQPQDPTDETVPGGTVPFDDEPGTDDDALSECYEEVDGEVAAACFATLIAAGEVEPYAVAVEMRHPECGMAGAYWEGYSTLGDAEFFALVDAARPCFLDLVERGEVEEWELGYEYTKPECFEGRNWYAVFDDPEYDDRYYVCISE